MNIKRLLIIFLIFILGVGLGSTFTYHPTPLSPPALYKAEAYFSPNGGVRAHIIKVINEVATSVDLAIFDLTSEDIKVSLENAKKRGIKIRIIADSRQAKGPHSVVSELLDHGFDVKITHGEGRGIMHNKFAIFDKKLMVTGSYNWTENAERFNYENAIFITDPNIIQQYQKDFDNILKKR